jgi:hypothetical protein
MSARIVAASFKYHEEDGRIDAMIQRAGVAAPAGF